MATCTDCICQYCCKYDRFFDQNDVENKCNYFKPTADVQEVKHGKWIENKKVSANPYCSVCGAVGGGSYCSHCGAKMDLVGD